MALPAANQPISFLQLQNEYGGSNPISLNEYYRSPNTNNTKNVDYGYQGNWAYNSGWSNLGFSKTSRHMVVDISTKYGDGLLPHQVRWVVDGVVVSNASLPAPSYSHADYWANDGGKAYILAVGSEPQITIVTKNKGGSQWDYSTTGAPQWYERETYAATGDKASQAGGTRLYYFIYVKTQTRSTVQQNSTVPISSTNNAIISMSNFASQGN